MKWATRCKRWKSKRARRLHTLDMRRLRAGGREYALRILGALNAMTDWETEFRLLYGPFPAGLEPLRCEARLPVPPMPLIFYGGV